MNIEYPYWYFDSAISSEKCNEIISLAKTKNKSSGSLISNKKKESISNNVIRNSTVAWIDDKWIFELIHPYIHAANKQAGWNFQWEFSEPCQFTEYNKGQFYGWHCDSHIKPYDMPGNPRHGKIRKLSMTLTLSNKSDYEGGDLQLWQGGNYEDSGFITAYKGAGSVFIFPSYMMHRVTGVTKGVRRSFVLWVGGSHYK